MEPREPGYSIFKGTKPEPKIVYELPDGTTTIWLNEYTDALVQAERERIIKLLEQHDDSGWCGNSNCPSPFPLNHLIALIKGDTK